MLFNPLMSTRLPALLVLLGLSLGLGLTPAANAAEPVTITFDAPEMAGISGFREQWDKPIVVKEDGAMRPGPAQVARYGDAPVADWTTDQPGAPVFDAVHRSLLVRFPGAAEQIAARLREGYTVEKVELLLPFRHTEYFPMGYMTPAGMSFLGGKWKNDIPRWHAVAWVLRQPWHADPKSGPTFNASIHDTAYWQKFGAQNEETDRFPHRFGPTEVSIQQAYGVTDPKQKQVMQLLAAEKVGSKVKLSDKDVMLAAKAPAEPTPARMDVTDLLKDNTFGDTLGQRLRVLADQGFLIRKWETYDAKYWGGGYEWANAIGPRGILIHKPSLVVTLTPGKSDLDKLPAPADIDQLAAQLKAGKQGGQPTATLPSESQIKAFIKQFAFSRPDWMPDWQYQRVQELLKLGGQAAFPETVEGYYEWVDHNLAFAPRRWSGFDAPDKTQEYELYEAAMPEPVKDHHKLYWESWLMPWMEAKDMAHGYIGGKEFNAWYEQQGPDRWKGNYSVYRTYNYSMGTMNFNHWCITGTLLGGAILENERLLADGRHGLEHWPLKTWVWYDGSTQESIDHYYFGHSLASQKVFADFAPSHLDRMMGRSMLTKSVEELASAFHPGIRRFISQSGRTGIDHLLVVQDGTHHIMHTLSKHGELHTLNAPGSDGTGPAEDAPGGMKVIGHNFRPGLVGQQTLNGPWAPAWFSNIVEEKPIPYEMTTNFWRWGEIKGMPVYRRSYLGHHYGVASQDRTRGNTVPFMAQWRRDASDATHAKQVGTLIGRYGVNETELLDSVWHDSNRRNPNGYVGTQGGPTFIMQHKNKMIVLASPDEKLSRDGRAKVKEVSSLQTTLGLFNFEDTPSWQLFIDGKPVTSYPATLKQGQRITIKDGVTYVGIIPIPGTNLGRQREVLISDDNPLRDMQSGGKAKVALRIDTFNYDSDTPVAYADFDRSRSDNAFGGYVIEVSGATEFDSFEQFQKHMADAQLNVTRSGETEPVHITYNASGDEMALTFDPKGNGQFVDRKVNGQWPYLPDHLDRDTTLTQQGRGGRLEKNGAVLTTTEGAMAYLQTEPVTGTYVGWNPFPDPIDWQLQTPGNVSITPDGKVGILSVEVRPADAQLVIDHALRDKDKARDDVASQISVSGLSRKPSVTLNGEPVQPKADGNAWTIPLR